MNEKIDDKSNVVQYVVRGATMKCSLGTDKDVLNLPFSHGVFLKDKAMTNIADSLGGKNIMCFGSCLISSPPPPCSPAVSMNWINGSETKLLIEGVEALLDDAKVTCSISGVIDFIDSGQ